MASHTSTRRSFLKQSGALLSTGSVATVAATRAATAAERKPGIYAGAAERDISPPEGLEITHYVRKNIGVHDSLFARALVLEDAAVRHRL